MSVMSQFLKGERSTEPCPSLGSPPCSVHVLWRDPCRGLATGGNQSTEDTEHDNYNYEVHMPQFSDEQVLGYLRNFLTNYRNQCPDPKEFCQSFRKDRRKIYPEQHYLIEQVLAEN